MTLAQKVKKGAKLLDQKMPGWFQKIDLDKLCMSDGTVCVLGQLFAEKANRKGCVNGFDFGSRELEFNDQSSACHYGFDWAKEDDSPWQELDHLWMQEVKARYDELESAIKKATGE